MNGTNTPNPLQHLVFEGSPRPVRGRFRRGNSVPMDGSPVEGLESEGPVDPLLVELLQSADLDARAYRADPLQRRRAACLRALRASSVQDARLKLARDPGMQAVGLNALLLGVTEFFRDASVFDALARLLACRRGALRVWSAACSNGAELYSMAMLLTEAGLLEDSLLLGTDCRASAIRQARRGEYAAADTTGLAGHRAETFLVRPNNGSDRWCIHPRLRERTRWAVQDLLCRHEPGPWDIILWRNHAIYLTPQAAGVIWHRLVGELQPGGMLVTGRAERPPRCLPLLRVAQCIYRKA